MLSRNQCWRCDQVTNKGKKCEKCHEAFYCSDRCCNNDKFLHKADCEDVTRRYICHGCGKANKKMLMCSNCMNAWFCDKTCLKKSWASHKTQCKEISTMVKTLAPKIKKKWGQSKTPPCLYYFGNTPAVDLLNLAQNEGQEYSEDLSLLLCGVGDPRNVILTISKLQREVRHGNVTFVLNDICACTLARTILLLYLLCKVDQDNAEAVTQIWYSLHLTPEHHDLVVSSLNYLVGISRLELLTRGIMKMQNPQQFKRVQTVWKTWLELSSKQIDITEQRLRMFQKRSNDIAMHLDEIPNQQLSSMREWFKHGVLLSEDKRTGATKENFTLTGSTVLRFNNTGSFQYNIIFDCLPFSGWDYKDACVAYPAVTDVNEMFNRYITDVLKQCVVRLQGDTIQMDFILCPCEDMAPLIPEGMTFDRITTSNLWDYIRLPRLLTLLKPMLKPTNKSAVIVTESLNWIGFFPLLHKEVLKIKLLPRSEENVFQDTGNRNIARSNESSVFVDYFSFLKEFTCFARASLLLEDSKRTSSFIPSLNQLAANFGLRPREFGCNGNKICPFRWKLNCRRITKISDAYTSVEWILL